MILVYAFNINVLGVKYLLKHFTKIVCDQNVNGDGMSSLPLFWHFSTNI